MTKPNIHTHTAAICKKLGLEAHMVRRLDITPSSVSAEVFLANDEGNKFIKDGEVAIETREFEVTA